MGFSNLYHLEPNRTGSAEVSDQSGYCPDIIIYIYEHFQFKDMLKTAAFIEWLMM